MAASIKNVRRGSLSFPNVKLMSYHLRMASKSSLRDGKQFWSCQYNDKKTEFTSVWVQGAVVNVSC